MTTPQKTMVAANVAVLAGAGIYEAREVSQLREQSAKNHAQSVTCAASGVKITFQRMAKAVCAPETGLEILGFTADPQRGEFIGIQIPFAQKTSSHWGIRRSSRCATAGVSIHPIQTTISGLAN